MGDLLVRNVPDQVIAALDRRARDHKVSREAEHRALLQSVLLNDKGVVLDRARALRAETKGRVSTSSEDLVRELRDSR